MYSAALLQSRKLFPGISADLEYIVIAHMRLCNRSFAYNSQHFRETLVVVDFFIARFGEIYKFQGVVPKRTGYYSGKPEHN